VFEYLCTWLFSFPLETNKALGCALTQGRL
jgi:hypothetical protein